MNLEKEMNFEKCKFVDVNFGILQLLRLYLGRPPAPKFSLKIKIKCVKIILLIDLELKVDWVLR